VHTTLRGKVVYSCVLHATLRGKVVYKSVLYTTLPRKVACTLAMYTTLPGKVANLGESIESINRFNRFQNRSNRSIDSIDSSSRALPSTISDDVVLQMLGGVVLIKGDPILTSNQERDIWHSVRLCIRKCNLV
jgi:hypothetical protein